MDPSQTSDSLVGEGPTEAGGPPSAGPHSAVPPHRTLPPPEWLGFEGPRSVASLALDRYVRGEPVARRSGTRAELESLSARMLAANAAGDEATERSTAASLARAFAARGAEFDQATRLARRSLLLGDDPVLREELAGWFTLLGEPALAAATLRPLLAGLAGGEAAELLVRIGTLLARAGEAHAAREAFEHALREAPEDAAPAEVAAAIVAWAPEAMPAADAAELYLDAYERRERGGDRAQAFENLIRAFEVAPDSAAVAERLSQVLIERGRAGAADEVRREHARHAGASERAVHLRRLHDAQIDGDLPRALGAALDARLDAELDVTGILAALAPREADATRRSVLGFDALLDRLALHELLAARLELAGDQLSGSERSRARFWLGQLYAGPLGRPDRGVDAWIDALVADPGNDEARQALLRHAAVTRDHTPLVEALVRVGQAKPASDAETLACLRELLALAEERLQDANLALWAATQISRVAPDEDALAETIARLAPRAHAFDEVLELSFARLERAEGSDRVEPLSYATSVLLSRPDRVDALVPVLLELCELTPEDRAVQLAIERVLSRQGRLEELESFYERLSARAPNSVERARLCLALANTRRHRGDVEGALATLASLTSEPSSPLAALCLSLLLAAQSGNEPLRARSLARLAGALSPPLRAVVAAVAAEALLQSGDVDAARRAADQSVQADPSLARGAAARAAVGLVTLDRWAAESMERAMGIVVPRAELCAALTRAYDELDDPVLALAYCQRLIALRPADLGAARERLERTRRSGVAARLADALGWLLAQPQPLISLAEPIAVALRTLSPLDSARGAALARRALDVIGPRSLDLRLAVLAVADIVGERGLAISAIERWLASGAEMSDRGELLLDLARRRRSAGDADGAARALMRAMREGAWGTAVLGELDLALPARSSDGEIALLAARAEALSALSEADQRGTARAWRELGAAYWDLASDPSSAVRAWERAVSLDLEYGVENLASDLLAFAGSELALARLSDLAGKRSDPVEAARVLAVASTIALEAGRNTTALTTAARALALDPGRADVLAVAERAATEEDLDLLEELYSGLAEAALGRFGVRAVHYRAARQLERRHAVKRALAHALLAFEAVPSEGIVFATLSRLGERAGALPDVVRGIQRVADAMRRPSERVAWLRRAALLADASEEGLRQRFDVLLRALAVQTSAEVLRELGDAALDLVNAVPDDRELVELRLRRAVAAVLPGLTGPDGARFAIALARLMIEVFAASEPAVAAIERALGCAGDLDDFAELQPFARELSSSAGALVTRLAALDGDRFANPSPALLELGARIAEERGDGARAAALFLDAARRKPDDADLVACAEAAVRASGDAALIARALETIPLRDRSGALGEMATAAEQSGGIGEAVAILERARAVEHLSRAESRALFERLSQLLRDTNDEARLESLLEAEIGDEIDDVARRSGLAAELASLVAARGDTERALSILELALRDVPLDAALLSEYARLARESGDRGRLIRALTGLAGAASDAAEALPVTRELAELLEQSGDLTAAQERWADVLRLDPNDATALGALEREAERRADYETLVSLLGRRAANATAADERRRIGLRRATVLEQRLGRADEARAELEALTIATGDHLSVLRVLADMNERLGSPLRAAPLWLRASAVAHDRSEAADLSCRACETYLDGGDVESARRVLEALRTWASSERILTLAVAIERRQGSPATLAEALDELAGVGTLEPNRRAELLLEAAHASLAAGLIAEALAQAARSAQLAPGLVGAQLLYRSLEYQQRGAGDPEEAVNAAAELSALPADLDPDRAELRAFLLAESLSVLGKDAAAEAELARTAEMIGDRPLIALGRAERLARRREIQAALAYYDVALAGDLVGLRGRGQIALEVAELARGADERDRAAGYLEIAAEDAETRERAKLLIAQLMGERAVAQASSPPPPVAEPIARGAAEPGPGRYSRRPDTPLAEDHVAPSLFGVPETLTLPGPDSPGRYSLRPEPERELPDPPERRDRTPDPLSTQLPKLSNREMELYSALAEGSVEAGRSLIEELERRGDRTHDRVAVCRRLCAVAPGDAWALDRLYDAALADKNLAYARAVEHVIRALEPGAPRIEPPALGEQLEQPDAVRALLLREHTSPALEALALVWEGAEHVFRRDASTYGITGLERVPLGAPTPLARVYSSAARALGMLRTPLFQRRSAGAITLSLALLSPPAVVLSGDVRQETPELRFHLGALMVAAMPQFVLLIGSAESQARAILSGLAFAFGPPQRHDPNSGTVPNLAEVLWESIPARMQRRLRELCDDPGTLDYAAAVRAARLATRRAGLFVCGDFGVALREVCHEEGVAPGTLETRNGLAAACSEHAAIRSLFLLATSAEYAQTRWHVARAATR